MTQVVSYPSERRLVALACRVLACEGLAETTLGHVSLRVDGTHLLVRARRASEHGLLFTTADDIALTDLDGNLHPGEPPISLPRKKVRPSSGAGRSWAGRTDADACATLAMAAAGRLPVR